MAGSSSDPLERSVRPCHYMLNTFPWLPFHTKPKSFKLLRRTEFSFLLFSSMISSSTYPHCLLLSRHNGLSGVLRTCHSHSGPLHWLVLLPETPTCLHFLTLLLGLSITCSVHLAVTTLFKIVTSPHLSHGPQYYTLPIPFSWACTAF